MQGSDQLSASESPDGQHESHGGVNFFRKVKDTAKKLKSKMKSKKPAHDSGVEREEPDSEDEGESDESPVTTEPQEHAKGRTEVKAGYSPRDLSGDKSEFSLEANSPGTVSKDRLGRLGVEGKDDKATTPADGPLPKGNLAARNEAYGLRSPDSEPSYSTVTSTDDVKHGMPGERETTHPLTDSGIDPIDSATPASLVAPAQQSPDISDYAGRDVSCQTEQSDLSESDRAVSESNGGVSKDIGTGQTLPVLGEARAERGGGDLPVFGGVTPWSAQKIVSDEVALRGSARNDGDTAYNEDRNSVTTGAASEKYDDAERGEINKGKVDNVGLPPNNNITDSSILDSTTFGERDEFANPASKVYSEGEKESYVEQASGEGKISSGLNKAPHPDEISAYGSTVDEQKTAEGGRKSKDRAFEGVTKEEEPVAGANIGASGFLDNNAQYREKGNSYEGGNEIGSPSADEESQSPRDQKSILQLAQDRIVGVTNYFSPRSAENNLPADEQDIGLPSPATDDQNKLPISSNSPGAVDAEDGEWGSDKHHGPDHKQQPQLNDDLPPSPGIASRAAGTVVGLKDSLASKIGYSIFSPTSAESPSTASERDVSGSLREASDGRSSPAAGDAGDGERGLDKQLQGPDHKQQPQLNDDQPSSPGIASRAAGTILGLKDTVASQFGYGTSSPTSEASASASEKDVSENLRENESPTSKSYVQQMQEAAAGGKESLLSKFGYGEHKQAPENVDQQVTDKQKSSPQEGKEIAEKVSSDTDHQSHVGESVSTEDHLKASNMFDPGEDEVALSQIITDTVSGTAAALKDTLLSPFSPKSSPKPSDSN